ncbi:MAG TPA: FAD:protein FMN transferase [Xanthobacteraceae bacterium]
MQSVTRRFFALGSDCALQIDAHRETDAAAAAEAAMQEVARIEARYSRYRPDSELSRINAIANEGGSVDLDPETAGLIDYAVGCFHKSDGLFDITSGLLRRAWDFASGRLPDPERVAALLPRIGLDKTVWASPRLTFATAGMELDFGGIGKEYAVDRAAGICRAMGIEHGLVDLGGDIRPIGPRPDGGPWRVGIRHPRDPSVAMTEIELVSQALATSGDYERFVEVDGRRYCHILDPRTGWPVRGLASVSVITADCLVAGSLATTAMLKGRGGVAWLASLGVRHVTMDETGRLGGTEPDRRSTPSC